MFPNLELIFRFLEIEQIGDITCISISLHLNRNCIQADSALLRVLLIAIKVS